MSGNRTARLFTQCGWLRDSVRLSIPAGSMTGRMYQKDEQAVQISFDQFWVVRSISTKQALNKRTNVM
jgi:hypothetical protein